MVQKSPSSEGQRHIRMQGVDVNGVNIGGALVLLALAVIATNVCLEHSQMAPGILSAKGGAIPRTTQRNSACSWAE